MISCKLYQLHTSLKFSDKIGLTMQIRMFNNIKHLKTISFTFGGRFLTSLSMVELAWKGSIKSKSKKTFFHIVVSFRHLLLPSFFNVF